MDGWMLVGVQLWLAFLGDLAACLGQMSFARGFLSHLAGLGIAV
jgi:hypothetical protein